MSAANYAAGLVALPDAAALRRGDASVVLHAATDTSNAGETLVVTVTLPDGCGLPDVRLREHTAVVTAPGGYRHEVALPLAADVDRLRAQLYDRYLELRAPRGPEPVERPVPVRVLRPGWTDTST